FHKKNRLFYQTASWRINLFGVPRDPRLFHFDFEASPEKFRSPICAHDAGFGAVYERSDIKDE
ncbi:hypothetical protein, partial [Galactobacillus timonensis]|uniref:hypothetical protein n=1 Tax=Galactobacillus timonensis TaxID=2041840 RepID=UPI001AEC527F